MIIYIDVVFLLNIFLDFILLMGISVILSRHAKIKRIFLGSLVGGVTTFLLFVNINSIMSLIIKLVLGILMVMATFGYKNIKYTFNNLFYLYTLSFSVGGVMYLLMEKGIYNYVVLIIGFVIVLFIYIKQNKSYQNSYANYHNVEIYIKNKKYLLTGFLDTGNKLYDTYKHRPVIIVNKKIEYSQRDIIYVPYITISEENVLKCLKADKVIIGKHVFKNYLVGLSNKEINIDGINCILHSKMKGELNV